MTHKIGSVGEFTRWSERGVADRAAVLDRQALETATLESYRSGHMTVEQLRGALGFAVLDEVDGFLKAHGVHGDYDMVDLERERGTLTKLGL